MAYKRTTKSSKGPNGTSIRQTRTYNDKTGKLTVSRSQSNGTSRYTSNTNNDTFLTKNNHGWISKKKLNAKTAARPGWERRKSPAGRSKSKGSTILALMFWIGVVFLWWWL